MMIGGTMLTRRRHPPADVVRQAVLAYRVGVGHLGYHQHAYPFLSYEL